MYFHILISWWVSLLVDQWVPKDTCNQVLDWLRLYEIYERLVPEMRICSILLIESDLKWYTSKKSLYIFQLLAECVCWWTSWFPRAHIAKFYGRLRLIRSVLRASKFSALKLIEFVLFKTVILLVYYTIPFGLSLFWHINFQLLKLLFWLIITDKGSTVPEMSIWSTLLIKSNLKWCVNLSRSLFS